MTQQVNGTTTDKVELSDDELYAAEWEKEDSPDLAPSASTGGDDFDEDGDTPDGQGKATVAATVPAAAVVDKASVPAQTQPKVDPAEGATDDDIWAQATPAQRQAFLKAQNDFQAMKGRHRTDSQRKADLEKELATAKATLAEASRVKGTYETEHPELFQEVTQYLTTKGVTAPVAAADTDEIPEDLKIVFKVHADVGDVMKTPEWAAYQTAFTPEQTAQFNSDNAFDFIDLITSFKTDQAVSRATNRNAELLAASAGAGGRGTGSQVTAKKSNMTDRESYDAEWDRAD